MQGALGVGCGVIGFLAYIGRSALNNTKMITGWRAANQAAKDRQLDAELKRAEAEEARKPDWEKIMAILGTLKTDIDAAEWERQIRLEWDERERAQWGKR
jgi:threonine dehydrogenase-like Zn-dependent dehydrogenase